MSFNRWWRLDSAEEVTPGKDSGGPVIGEGPVDIMRFLLKDAIKSGLKIDELEFRIVTIDLDGCVEERLDFIIQSAMRRMLREYQTAWHRDPSPEELKGCIEFCLTKEESCTNSGQDKS